MSSPITGHRARIAAILLVGALAVTGCGKSSSGGDAAATTVAPTTTAAPATTTTEAATTTTEAETTTTAANDDLAALKEKAQGALLTPAEVGTGFSEDTYTNDSGQPAPCGGDGPDTAIPAAVLVGAVSTNGTEQAALQEEIRVYNDEAEAQQAYAVFQKSLDCTSGTISNSDGTTTPVTIDAQEDIKAIDPNISEGYATSLKSADFDGEAVVARVSAIVVTLQFVNAPDADTSNLPDPQKLVSDAITKAANA